MNNVNSISFMAILGALATFTCSQANEGRENELARNYSGLTKISQSSSRFGWIPKETTTDGAESAAESAKAGSAGAKRYLNAISNPERAKRRQQIEQSLRQNRQTNPYAWKSETDRSQVECLCGGNCNCPPLVCDKGDCLRNYVAVFSASWCGPCQKMVRDGIYSQLREEGYIVYYYDIDKFEDIDVKFEITAFPSFLIFDKGGVVHKHVGPVSIEWFREHLKTRKQQDVEKPIEPLNPYVF